MTKGWTNQDAGTVVREIGITQVKQESTEGVEEWEKLGMQRSEWVSATVKQMSEDVAHVADKFETVLKDLEEAKRDVNEKEVGLFAIGKEFATRYLDTKMVCHSEKQCNGMLSDWQSDRLQGVMSNVPEEFHESV